MTHLAAQEAALDGSTVTWCEAVTEITYTAPPRAIPSHGSPENNEDDH